MTVAGVRPVARAMRLLLVAGGVFTLVAGAQLFLLSEQTDRYFAWTIASPLTAAVLGSFYWSAATISLWSSRRTSWAGARVSLPGVTAFVILTMAATLLHLETFHVEESGIPWAAAWGWLGVYALEPVGLGFAWVAQRRVVGVDPVRAFPLPGWVRGLLIAQSAVALIAGAALFVAPVAVGEVWPWALTPLAARALAAWLIGYGGVGLSAARENDRGRVLPALGGSVVLAALVAIAFARYGTEVEWSSPAAWGAVGVLGLGATAGIGGLATGRRGP